MKMNTETIEILHRASQYLAAFGISFVEKKADDSHTNLNWNPHSLSLETRSVINDSGGAVQLALDCKSFALVGIDPIGESVLYMDHTKHRDVIEWLRNWSKESGLTEVYDYRFHYELPYPAMADLYTWKQPSEAELQAYTEEMNRAKSQFSAILNNVGIESELRVWPHHFDLGFFGKVPSHKTLSIGGGKAIPDSLSSDSYYYISGWYENGSAVNVERMPPLTKGTWGLGNFNGSILSIRHAPEELLTFLQQSTALLIQHR